MTIHYRFSKCPSIFVETEFVYMITFNIHPDAPIVYSEKYLIRSYHVDRYRKLTIQKLCSFFQDIAGNHTVACGVGWEVMQEAQLFWVLSRLKISIIKFPEWRDRIVIRTWSNGLDGLMAVRHFQVLDEKGEELVRAVSMWLMVNTTTRRLVRPEGYMENFPLHRERLFFENPDKIEGLNEPVRFEPARVLYTETDMNQHMNNVSYIDRIMNCYNPDYLSHMQIEAFEINFLKEAIPGESIVVQQEQTRPDTFLHNIVQSESDKEMVRTYTIWKSINPDHA
jgi:medium-chain acyl-[acyl-carrier-protein] hydrolase